MRIGIFGGTGPAGTALGARLASVGYDIVLGSRSKYRAMEARDQILAAWPDRELSDRRGRQRRRRRVRAHRDRHAVGLRRDDRTRARARTGRARSSSRWPTRSCVWARSSNRSCRRAGRSPPTSRWRCPAAGSSPRSTTCRRRSSANLDHSIDSDVLICSDDAEAIKDVSEIVRKIPGCRPLDAGELSNATAIEAFTAVLLQLNVRYQHASRTQAHGNQGLSPGVSPCRCVSTTPPARRWSPSSRGPPSRCTPAASRRTTPPISGTRTVYVTYDVLQRRLIDLGHTVQVRAERHRRRRSALRQGA